MRLIDFDTAEENDWSVVTELPCQVDQSTASGSFRPDITVFVNAASDEAIKEAMEVEDVFTKDEVAKRSYEKAEKFRRDQAAQLKYAEKKVKKRA